ncbi:hypothetical protein [Pseudonocardia lacus]|uniref:hypothetical protein n=1 Tax=Pseudonocardia lacus TaxID=2835865 RepID=UPI001BDD0F8C|nr:hypothetical protein [Pseudonocardia lacus]
MKPVELVPLDRGQLLREIETQALRDSQSDWADAAETDLPPAPVHREIDRWADQRLAQIAAARSADEQEARARIRTADAAEAAADERRALADAAAAGAERRQEEIAAVLRGERAGDDGGDWSDRDRMTEDRSRQRLVDCAIYGAAGVAEIGLNYLAFRLMGATPAETALLAGAVVLVTVLLPKQLGTLVTTARRTRRWTGWPLVLMVCAAVLWVGVTAFVAVVRTAYLLLPLPVGTSVARPLLAVAGIEPMWLTVGWLAVALAVGLAVLLRSAHRHNPYAAAWHAAATEVERLAAARSQARDDAGRAAEHTAHERDALRAVAERYAPPADECRALAAELKDRYVHALGRRRTSVEQRRLPPGGRAALEPPEGGAAA